MDDIRCLNDEIECLQEETGVLKEGRDEEIEFMKKEIEFVKKERDEQIEKNRVLRETVEYYEFQMTNFRPFIKCSFCTRYHEKERIIKCMSGEKKEYHAVSCNQVPCLFKGEKMICQQCKRHICSDCTLNACRICKKDICNDCNWQCKCGRVCTDHMRYCSYMKSYLCNECIPDDCNCNSCTEHKNKIN